MSHDGPISQPGIPLAGSAKRRAAARRRAQAGRVEWENHRDRCLHFLQQEALPSTEHWGASQTSPLALRLPGPNPAARPLPPCQVLLHAPAAASELYTAAHIAAPAAADAAHVASGAAGSGPRRVVLRWGCAAALRRRTDLGCHLWVLLQVPRHAALIVLHQHSVLQAAGGPRDPEVQLPLRIHRRTVACRAGRGGTGRDGQPGRGQGQA